MISYDGRGRGHTVLMSTKIVLLPLSNRFSCAANNALNTSSDARSDPKLARMISARCPLCSKDSATSYEIESLSARALNNSTPSVPRFHTINGGYIKPRQHPFQTQNPNPTHLPLLIQPLRKIQSRPMSHGTKPNKRQLIMHDPRARGPTEWDGAARVGGHCAVEVTRGRFVELKSFLEMCVEGHFRWVLCGGDMVNVRSGRGKDEEYIATG
jgi:hypothetical protein